MPAFAKNRYLLLAVLSPFIIAILTSLFALFLLGFKPLNILVLGFCTILGSSVLALFLIFIIQRFLNGQNAELSTLLDGTVVSSQTKQSIAHSKNITAISAEVVNTYAKSFFQWHQTAQKLEILLEAEKEKVITLMHNMTDPIIGLDLRLNIAFINPAAEKVLGLDTSLVIGQQISQILKFQSPLGELAIAKIAPLRTPGYEGVLFSQNEVKVLSLLNDKEASTNIITTQLKHGHFINLACVISFHDVTAEKQLEAMKLDFISMAAHELRTPLTSIKGYISVFIQENEKKLSEDQMMFIRRINNSALQLSALIENLLGVSRVERGAMTITTQPMDWEKTLQIAYEQFEHRAIEKRIDLQFIKPKTPLPTVQADNVRINEVINNFVVNAINYTEPGGKVTIWTEFKDSYIYTHVTDTGRGLPKEAINKLFTKFYRVPGNLDQASKGNGLGLYISKAIVELHHGKIWAESPGLGKGSTFSFSLPVVETAGMDLNVLTKKL